MLFIFTHAKLYLVPPRFLRHIIAYTSIGWPAVLCIVGMLIYLNPARPFDDIARLMLASFLAVGVSFIIKYLVERPRPPNGHRIPTPVDSSFPSSHTASVCAPVLTALLLSFYTPIPLIAFAVYVALSRYILRMHYISDILGGGVTALIVALFLTHSSFISFLFS